MELTGDQLWCIYDLLLFPLLSTMLGFYCPKC